MTVEPGWPRGGWFLSVSLHCELRGADGRELFAVAIESEAEAMRALRSAIGPISVAIAPVCQLSTRALMRLRIKPGGIKRLPVRGPRFAGTLLANPRRDGRYWPPRSRAN